MTAEAIKCPVCGAKIRGDRSVCPRCLSPCAPAVDPAAAGPAAPPSSRLDVVVMGVVALSLALGGYAWMFTPRTVDQGGAVAVARPAPIRAADGRSIEAAATPAAAAPITAVDAGDAALGADAYRAGDLTAAVEHYDQALERNPDDAESLSNKGQVLVRQGKAEEALPYFDRAIALIPQRWAYRFNKARALGVLNRWPEAVASYREAQALFPNDYATAFNLGQALHRAGDEKAAVVEYRKAIELSPEDASFHFALAISLERLQQPREAAEAYGHYLRLAPAAPEAEQVRARITALTGPKSDAEVASR
jgi:tetratricopeptide (TPR) repeat protein